MSSLRVRRFLEAADARASAAGVRLAAGSRIAKAADDAAGLSVAALLDVDARVSRQAVRNLNDGASLLNTYEGAFFALSSIVLRQQELASQAASGTYGTAQRLALDREAVALTDEYNRLVRSTSYNGLKLFGGEGGVTLQAGSGPSSSVAVTLGGSVSTVVGTGAFGAPVSYAAGGTIGALRTTDVNGDGKSDVVVSDEASQSVVVLLGNGDGSFLGPRTTSFGVQGTPNGFEAGDYTGDGRQDLLVSLWGGGGFRVLTGNGDGTFSLGQAVTPIAGAQGQDLIFTDVDGDGRGDVVQYFSTDAAFAVALGNGDGTFSAARTYASAGAIYGDVADVNGDSHADVLSYSYSYGDVEVALGNGDGTFRAAVSSLTGAALIGDVSDLDGDGVADLVTLGGSTMVVSRGRGDGTFAVSSSRTLAYAVGDGAFADVDGDGVKDVVYTSQVEAGATGQVLLGRRDGTFADPVTFSGAATDSYAVPGVADFDGDGAVDLAVAGLTLGTVRIFRGVSSTSAEAAYVDLRSAESARESLATLGGLAGRLAAGAASAGADRSRLGAALRVTDTRAVTAAAASARITDVDVAEETATYVTALIRRDAAAALLGQANQSAGIVLSLLARP